MVILPLEDFIEFSIQNWQDLRFCVRKISLGLDPVGDDRFTVIEEGSLQFRALRANIALGERVTELDLFVWLIIIFISYLPLSSILRHASESWGSREGHVLAPVEGSEYAFRTSLSLSKCSYDEGTSVDDRIEDVPSLHHFKKINLIVCCFL